MKCNILLKICFITAFCIANVSLYAQQFDSTLKKLDSEFPQEKLYLHFDRSLYNAGETIWFKAYLFAGNNLSLISKTLYADLLDEQGKLIEHKIAPVLGSTSASSFDLPANITGSFVFVRVYTKWMLNFDSSFLYVKAIPLSAAKKLTVKQSISTPKFFLQFFPEGGDLVEGVESKVAFKATDARGLPIRVTGAVVDGKERKITSFASVHDGMGYFILQPATSEQYKAVWKDESGATHQTILPSAKKRGLVLSVKNSGGKLDFTIKHSANALSLYQNAYIIAQTQQQLLYEAKANLTKTEVVHGSIPVEAVPAGIMQVTLFTQDGKPLAERIVFTHQQDYYFITDLNAPLKAIDKRKKNVIQLDVPDTLHCNLSVAVTDAELNPLQSGDDNIYSHVLLTSDIKGYVHNPSYYFSSDADSVAQHLDLIMMTNGWRRFKWEDVLSDHWPVLKYQPENYLAIEGKISGLNKTELGNREINAILNLKNDRKEFLNIPVHKDGSFTSSQLLFYDTAHLYYQFNNDKYKTLTSKADFYISNSFLKEPVRYKPDNWFLALRKPDSIISNKNNEAFKKYLAQQRDEKIKTLTTVVITAKAKSKKEKMEEEYTSGLFSGGDATTFIVEGDAFATTSLNVLNYLQGKVAGLQINTNGAQPSLSWRGGTPGLYLNEVQSQADVIQSIPMSDVAMIKVFRPPFLGGFGGGDGAIAVYLKKGASGGPATKGLDFTNISGYSSLKQFYSPDYANTDEQASQNDYRKTLYWSPFVLTDKDHRRIQLSFYNNDITKKIRVVVEGINEEGKLTHIEKIFE